MGPPLMLAPPSSTQTGRCTPCMCVAGKPGHPRCLPLTTTPPAKHATHGMAGKSSSELLKTGGTYKARWCRRSICANPPPPCFQDWLDVVAAPPDQHAMMMGQHPGMRGGFDSGELDYGMDGTGDYTIGGQRWGSLLRPATCPLRGILAEGMLVCTWL